MAYDVANLEMWALVSRRLPTSVNHKWLAYDLFVDWNQNLGLPLFINFVMTFNPFRPLCKHLLDLHQLTSDVRTMSLVFENYLQPNLSGFSDSQFHLCYLPQSVSSFKHRFRLRHLQL
jgi:hypothetical protein